MRVNITPHNFCFFVAALVLSVVFVPKLGLADTEVTGLIREPVTWTLAQSPILVNGDFGAATDGSLTIEPGVIVKFGPDAQLLSGGGWIKANGTADQPIIFTSASESPEPGDWNRISLSNPTDEVSFAKFEYGASCLDLSSSINISHLDVQNCQKGVFLRTAFAGRVEDSKFSHNTYGLYLEGNASPIIHHNQITDNTFAGIYMESSLTPTITNNDILNNQYGIGSFFTSGTVAQNNIYGNTNFGIKVFTFVMMNAANNWWGDPTGPLSSFSNPTGLGDKVEIPVIFNPWALAAFDNFSVISPPPPPPPDDPPVDPDPEPSGPTPVLIIPGIMGTELYDGEEFIWPNIGRLLPNPIDSFLSKSLILDNNGNSIRNITTGDIIRKLDIGISETDMFESLFNTFTQAQYQTNQNIFIFPYDWRLDLSISKDLLAQKIEEIKNQTNFDKIDIVAHSMGGLLAEDYINSGHNSNIRKLVFVGTPHLGAPKAARALLSGDIVAFHAVNASRIKEISLNSPSIYQLLPNSEYFDSSDGYIKPWPIGEVINYSATKNFLSEMEKNSSLIHRAENFHSNLSQIDYGEIEVSNIVGCKTSTQSLYYIDKQFGTIKYIESDSGDGTVPLASAGASQGTQYYVKNGKHAELPSSEGVKQSVGKNI